MKLTLVATALTGAVALAAGSTWYSGKTVNESLDQLPKLSQESGGMLSFDEVSRERSFTGTRGQIAVKFNAACANPGADPVKLPLSIRYEAQHVPGLHGLAAFNLQVALEDDAPAPLRALLNGKPLLAMDGQVGWQGKTQAKWSTPEIQHAEGRSQLKVAASEGEILEQGNGVGFAWRLPQVNFSERKQRMAMKNLTFAGQYTDLELGLGSQTFGIESIQVAGPKLGGGSVDIHQIRIDQSFVERDGKLHLSSSPTVASIQVPNQAEVVDVGFTMAFNNIDAGVARELNKITSKSPCNMLEDEATMHRIEQLLLDLVDGGMEFGITNIRGRQGENHFKGDLLFTLDAHGSQLTLPERLQANASFQVSDALVPPPVAMQMVGSGLVQEQNGQFVADLKLGPNGLMIAGQPDQNGLGDMAGNFLMMGEQGLSQWRESVASGEAPLMALARLQR